MLDIGSFRSAQGFALLSLLALCATSPAPAGAMTRVKVTLSDKGVTDMPTGMEMGMTADMSKSPMKISAEPSVVRAGEVEFDATNASKDLVHEMLIVPIPNSGTMPYSASDSAIDEEKAGSLGEVSELDPGKGGKLTLTLAPGKYALLCNVPGHYAAGMWAVLTVR